LLTEQEFFIKNLASFLGVSVRTIKNWEKEGKIKEARRNKWEWRVYTQAEMEEIKERVEAKNYFHELET